MTERMKVKKLIDGIYENDLKKIKEALDEGANPNYYVNGYPIIIHAVYLKNLKVLKLLLENGANDKGEALGYALLNGIGEVVMTLFESGAIAKYPHILPLAKSYPCR